MAKYATDDTIEFAGDYFLPNVVLHNHEGEGLTPDKKVMILKQSCKS